MHEAWSGDGSLEDGTPGNEAPEREFRLVRESQWRELVEVLRDHEAILAALVRESARLNRETGHDRTVLVKHRNARERPVPSAAAPRSEHH